MRLVYFSPVKWNSYTQRSHEFVRWFHHKHDGEVLWIDPYPTRLPTLNDFNRLRIRRIDDIHNIPDWIQVCTPNSLPVEPLRMFVWVNHFLFWKTIERIVKNFVRETPCYLFIGKPSALALKILSKYIFAGTYYDAMDHFAAFYKGLSRRSMAKKERDVAKDVQTVITSSSSIRSA